MTPPPGDDLPDCNSLDLVLRPPTAEESVAIWNNTSAVWRDSLTIPIYLEESSFLTTVPLARNEGMSTWALVHEDIPSGTCQILCSCETFRKRSLTSDARGKVSGNVVHGIASVFCPAPYRRRGYAGRMMQELAKELYRWQTATELPCVGSTLYSDIGKEYYTKLGWHANSTNSQIEIPPKAGTWPSPAKAVLKSDLEDLCKRDEAFVRSRIAMPTDELETRFTIIPDLDHMGWHIGKEEFATEYLFGRTPSAKGAIAGEPGNQIWATWAHRYYARHDVQTTGNVLYILRLVVELDETATRLQSDVMKRPAKGKYDEQVQLLKAVLQAAQSEAAEWKLDAIELWDPTPLVMDLLAQSGLEYTLVDRQEDSIASLLWYDRQGAISNELPFWVNNEHYAWQ